METGDGNNWQSPPVARVSLGRPLGPCGSTWGTEVPEAPTSLPAASISGCPAETPFCSQALALCTSPDESGEINEERGVPLPTGDAERHFYLQLEPDGLGKDSPPFHPDHWSTSKAAEARPGSHEHTQPVPSPVPAHQSLRPPVPGGGKRAAGTLLGPWLLTRAGWLQGRACDRLHQMGPEERGLREAGRLCPGGAFGAPFSHPAPQGARQMGQRQSPLLSLTKCFWGTTHGKDAWLCPSSLPALLLCQALRHPTVGHAAVGHPKPSPCCSWPQHRAGASWGRGTSQCRPFQGHRGTAGCVLGTGEHWPHGTARWHWACSQLHVPNAAPVQARPTAQSANRHLCIICNKLNGAW